MPIVYFAFLQYLPTDKALISFKHRTTLPAHTLCGGDVMLGVMALFLQAAAGHVLYLALRLESGSFPWPLPPEAERAAFAAMRAGGTAARDKLIRHNLRLVAHVAKKYYAVPGAQDDMISIGTIGLIKAVDTFCPERRVRFASYASQCIENPILPPKLQNIKNGGSARCLRTAFTSCPARGPLALPMRRCCYAPSGPT